VLTHILAIDDTDNDTSIGTGRLARMLGEHLEELGLARQTGVTRHQLLVDPRIPYTSHNSAAAIGLTELRAPEGVRDAAVAFLARHFHEGADPGLAIAALPDSRASALTAFGRRAQIEVLEKDEAYALAAQGAVWLSEHGGTGQGVIGALAALALRASGDDGRFIGLAGIRRLGGVCTVAEILAGSGVEAVLDPDGRALPGDARVDTGDWVRPALLGHRACLRVQPGEEGAWRVVRERKGTDDG